MPKMAHKQAMLCFIENKEKQGIGAENIIFDGQLLNKLNL